MNVKLSDLIQPKGIPGIEVSGNEIFFDTFKLLPPPHIRGQLTKVRVVSPDIEEVFGNAEDAVTRVEQWRNFLRLNDGTIDFGKLTMHHVDLIMVDLSDDAWFDLDLNNYQNQLVNGYTRMTPASRPANLHARSGHSAQEQGRPERQPGVAEAPQSSTAAGCHFQVTRGSCRSAAVPAAVVGALQ